MPMTPMQLATLLNSTEVMPGNMTPETWGAPYTPVGDVIKGPWGNQSVESGVPIVPGMPGASPPGAMAPPPLTMGRSTQRAVEQSPNVTVMLRQHPLGAKSLEAPPATGPGSGPGINPNGRPDRYTDTELIKGVFNNPKFQGNMTQIWNMLNPQQQARLLEALGAPGGRTAQTPYDKAASQQQSANRQRYEEALRRQKFGDQPPMGGE